MKSKEIDLETFVPEADVNPMMFDSSYLVLPDKNAKPYALLADAMAGSGRVGIGRFVMRQKEYLAAIRSDGSHLTLSTLVFPDELVEPDSIEEFEELDGVEISDKELKMAQGLVDALSDDFQPEQYIDEYRAGRREDHRGEGRRAHSGVRGRRRRRGPPSSTSPPPSRPASREARGGEGAPPVGDAPPSRPEAARAKKAAAAAAEAEADAEEAPKARKTRARKSA